MSMPKEKTCYGIVLQQVDFENKNKSLYALTWEHSMAPKYDLYSDSMQTSSWVQFNIVLGIINADLEKKLLIRVFNKFR